MTTTKLRENAYFREVVAGSIGGASGVLVGHPLDLLKVNQQNHRNPLSATLLFLQLFRGKPSDLFRGLLPPIVNGVVYQASMFPGYRLALDLIGKPSDRPEMLWESALAGVLAGLLTTIGTTPLEVAKIKLQLDPAANAGHRGATTRQLIALFRAGQLYSGWPAMAWRDGPGTGVYMAAYQWLKAQGSTMVSSRESVEFVSGGLAGVVCWLSILPFDTAKTRMQFDAGVASPMHRYQSLSKALASIAREEGVAALFSGWKPLCMRAFPVNAVTFFVYERILQALDYR